MRKWNSAAWVIVASAVVFSLSAAASRYLETDLISDQPNTAPVTDARLVNPWGIDASPTGPWWVADNKTGLSTVYNAQGQPFPLANPIVVTIPPPPGQHGPSSPTGIVFNGSTSFPVAPNHPATFIFVTEDGTVSAWNNAVNPKQAILKVDNSKNSIYKGVTIGSHGGANFLYAANFHQGTVDVWDANFSKVVLPSSAFQDVQIPAGYAPFNVQNINGQIYVAFAKQDDDKEDEEAGAGLGYVDAFDTAGNLLMRLENGSWMNAPWAVTLAPDHFGDFSKHLLVGQFGSGQIAAFNPQSGKFVGLLEHSSGKPVAIEGLWGLKFGNGGTAGHRNDLFFAAGVDDEEHGLFGKLTAIP